jgi:hypothetical protein
LRGFGREKPFVNFIGTQIFADAADEIMKKDYANPGSIGGEVFTGQAVEPCRRSSKILIL